MLYCPCKHVRSFLGQAGLVVRWKNVLKCKNILTTMVTAFCFLVIAVMVKAYLDGEFQSVETFQEYIRGYGVFAPAALIMIQALQVIFPILPGFLGCAAGAVLFGSAGGFWCNYIGISAGSIIAFLLAKRYGAKLVEKMFSKKQYEKYSGWAGRSKSYVAFLFLGMALPLFPDDFFCYFSGLTKMQARKFALIIILGKPWCILAYSLAFAAL